MVNLGGISWQWEHIAEDLSYLIMDRRKIERDRKWPGTKYPQGVEPPSPRTYFLQLFLSS
jgi:hypothetical protein